ncbi:MAG: NHL repeat-containing protein, partial [candidate division WOR-3 bacterium]
MLKRLFVVGVLFFAVHPLFATLERMGYEFGGQMYYKLTKKIVQDSFEIALFQEPYDGVGYTRGDTGFCFVTDAMWHRIIYARGCETDQEHYYTKSLGFWGTGVNQFKSPHGVAIDAGHNIYIADTDNGRIVRLQLQGDSLVWINEIGEEILEKPWDVEIEGNKIYVVDAGLHKVFRFSLTGGYELSYGGYGSTQGKFNAPKGIAVFGNLIYISDTENRRVVVLRDWGNIITFVRWLYPEINQNHYFLDMEVDNRGVVYLCDGAQSRILKFSPGLKTHCYSFGGYGAGMNQFRHPRGMFIQDTVIAIIEEWTDDSGIQAYKEKVSIKEFQLSKSVFDATEQEIKISFRIDDYSTGARLTIGDREWNFTGLIPDTTYQVIWDGRHNNGTLFLPGDYIVRLSLDEGAAKTASVKVKGTIKSGVLSPNEHWTEEGEPYVLVGDVQVPGGGRLTIDPGVKVMPVGNYGILPRYQYPYWHHIYAQGTVLNKILFTPHRKLYPTPDSIPKGFWRGIDFHTASWEDSLIFTNCIIE